MSVVWLVLNPGSWSATHKQSKMWLNGLFGTVRFFASRKTFFSVIWKTLYWQSLLSRYGWTLASIFVFICAFMGNLPTYAKERNETKRNCTDLVKNLGEHMFVQYWYILGTVWNHCWCQCVQYGQLPGNKAMLFKPPKQTMKLSYTRWEIKESKSGTTLLIWGHLLYFETNVL